MSKDEGSEEAARLRFGKLIRKLRGQAGLSQTDLAGLAMVSQSAVSDLELGRKGTRRDPVVRLDRELTGRGALVGAWDAVFCGSGGTTYFREGAESEQADTFFRECSLGLVRGLSQGAAYVR